MAKKANKISVNALDSVVDGINEVMIEEWDGIEVAIKHTIGLTEMLEMVNNVVESCFDKNGDYIPEAKDLVIRCEILTKFANFTLPANIEKKYRCVMLSGAVEFVCSKINEFQLNEILSSIDKKIAYRCDSGINAIREQFTSLIASMEAMQSQTENKVVAARGIDEEKLVKAYADHVLSKKG